MVSTPGAVDMANAAALLRGDNEDEQMRPLRHSYTNRTLGTALLL